MKYYESWEYIWETEKQRLDYEIGKTEGQLKNCIFRIDLAKREMIVCGFSALFPLLFIIFTRYLSPGEGSLIGNLIVATGLTIGLVVQILYICLLPFLVYYMIKGMTLYLVNVYEPVKEEPLRVVSGSDKEIPEPEKSYAAEERKLVKVLSCYYEYRNRMEQLKWQLTQGEVSMTAEELQEEIDQWKFYEEITPAIPFSKSMKGRTWIYTVIVCIVILFLLRI